MNRKQKRELHQRQSTRQLMGIAHITPHGIRTETGERVFYLIRPDNLSVLSPEVIRSRIRSLTVLLSTQSSLELLALDSRESFQQNKEYYRDRLEEETAPEVRALLERDLAHLDAIQALSQLCARFAVTPEPRRKPVKPLIYLYFSHLYYTIPARFGQGLFTPAKEKAHRFLIICALFVRSTELLTFRYNSTQR